MERRSALKNMGLAFSYAVATPSLLGVLESCKKQNTLNWTPSFLTQDEAYVVQILVDIILPKTDTPSASEMNVHIFIDEFASKAMRSQEETIELVKGEFEKLDAGKISSGNRDFLRLTMNTFIDNVLEASGKEHAMDLESQDLEPILAKHLKKRSDEMENAHEDLLDQYAENIQKNGTAELDKEVALYSFANDIRNMATWAYKSSEYVGEEVLAYAPVPGEYIACGNVNELTGGKAWSL